MNDFLISNFKLAAHEISDNVLLVNVFVSRKTYNMMGSSLAYTLRPRRKT